MKKIFCMIIAAIMLVAAVTAVSAQSYNPQTQCDVQFKLKKADASVVIKDGFIGEGEYERLDVDTNPDTTCINMAFGSAEGYAYAEEALQTAEYYFSWDEVHGFNFACRFKPVEGSLLQVMDVCHDDPDGKPMDDFLTNVGFDISCDEMNPRDRKDDQDLFYYAIAKRTTDGQYLKGHWNQLGLTGTYDPTPEVDFIINYEAGGTVLCEWSIPFEHIAVNPTAGGVIFFSIGMTAGMCSNPEAEMDEKLATAYCVSLGDYCYLVDNRNIKSCKHVVATISDELIAATAPDTTPGTTPDSNPDTDNPGTEPGKNTDPVDTNNPGTDPSDSLNPDVDPVNPADPTNPSNPTNPTNPTNPSNPGKAPSTADPIVIAAIASAISACGFMVSKKRK